MITFPKTAAAAAAASGSIRAGGTDEQELRHLGIHGGDLIDLRDTAGLDRFEVDEVGLHLGAGVRLADIASDARVVDGFPAIAQTAGGLATPQIRNRASLAGSLLQEVRCWYYRHPQQLCLKKGGSSCLAREGDHLFHSCFDLGACVAPHPSSMAVALLAHDAQVELDDGSLIDIPTLLGDGSDPKSTHSLPDGRVVVAVHVPLSEPGERAAYGRAISRARAEWPLVEVVARLWIEDSTDEDEPGTIIDARVTMGGVANRPLALDDVEAALIDQPASDEVLAAAAAVAAEGAQPLPMTGYKVKLVPGQVLAVLTQARDAGLAAPLGLPVPPDMTVPAEVTP